MKLAQTSTLLICLLGAPGISLAADAKGDVEKAYAAWDAAFNKHDEKAIGASYVATAKLMPPTHQVASGPAEITVPAISWPSTRGGATPRLRSSLLPLPRSK